MALHNAPQTVLLFLSLLAYRSLSGESRLAQWRTSLIVLVMAKECSHQGACVREALQHTVYEAAITLRDE